MSEHPYVRLLRRNLIVLVVAVLVGGLAGLAASLAQRPVYQSTAQVFVSLSQATNVQDLSQGNTFAQQAVKSYSTVVTTPAVLQPVINDLDLGISPSELGRHISVDNPLNTVILNIGVEYQSPRMAADIANGVSQQLAITVEGLTPSQTGDSTSPVTVTQITPALPATSPSAPRPVLYVSAGAAVILALAVLTLLVRSRFDLRLRAKADVEQVTKSPILGSFPFAKSALDGGPARALSQESSLAESYNQLRTSLQFFGMQAPLSAILISSSMPGEGKTTSSLGLALSLARGGHRTLLIDADLRRPKIADYLGVDGSVGVTDVLIGNAAYKDATQVTAFERLDVLPAGTIPPNPAELLQSAQMETLIGELRGAYEYLVIDAPPLLPVTDARVLSHLVDGVLMTCSVKQVTRPQLLSALDSLRLVDARVLGLLVTMLPSRGPDAYGGYYGYGYGNVDLGGDSAAKASGPVTLEERTG